MPAGVAVLDRINEGVVARFANMPATRVHFALLALLFARAASGVAEDCRWRDAVEFWSSVVCAMENIRTVNFHVAPGGEEPAARHPGRCLGAFVRDVARKCGATIVSRTYAPPRSESASFVELDSDAARRARRPSIWKIAPGDASRRGATPSSAERTRRDKAGGENTWNVHVILARGIRFLGRISEDGSSFVWNPHDRFIALIARQEEPGDPDSTIDDVLRALWRRRKVQSVFVSEMTQNDTARIVRTYNPFMRVNDSAWGKIEVIHVKTAKEVSSTLSDLKYRRTKNMNQYEVKVGIFSEEDWDNSIYTYPVIFKGPHRLMLEIIATDMNFKPDLTYPTDNEAFGYRLPNGTYIGALGDVIYGRTDMCAESFFIKKYSTDKDDIEFSTYVDFDKVCVLVPKAQKIPKKVRVFHVFPLSIWILSMAMNVLAVVTWYYLQVFTPGRTGNVSFRKTFYRSIPLNVGCPQKMPRSNAERILLSGVLLANVTMVGIFSGTLYNCFAQDMYYPDIDDLQTLDSSGLPLTLTSFSLIDLFGSENNPDLPQTMQNLRKKMIYGSESLEKASSYRNVSGLAKESHFPIFNEQYIDANGARLLHQVRECPGAYYLAYLLPRDSILRERINIVIGRLNQAGLPMLWKRSNIIWEVVHVKNTPRKGQQQKVQQQQEGFVPFDLSDMQSSFYTLLIGLSISTVVFFHERGWIKTPLPRRKK